MFPYESQITCVSLIGSSIGLQGKSGTEKIDIHVGLTKRSLTLGTSVTRLSLKEMKRYPVYINFHKNNSDEAVTLQYPGQFYKWYEKFDEWNCNINPKPATCNAVVQGKFNEKGFYQIIPWGRGNFPSSICISRYQTKSGFIQKKLTKLI